MKSYITIGEIIRHYRKERGMSQEKLAKGICDRKYLSHIENNKNIPTLDIINQLSNSLGVNLYDNYALMLRHHDITTHKEIESLIPYLSGETTEQLSNHHMLPELLLCKCYLLMQDGQQEEAKELYTLAHSLGNYLYDPIYQKEHNEEYLLGEYYTYFSC